MSNRGQILQEAHEIINGHRQTAHGTPENTFSLIADFWNVYLSKRDGSGVTYGKLSSHDVAMMMALFKMARVISGTEYHDSLIDACGYIALGHDLKISDAD